MTVSMNQKQAMMPPGGGGRTYLARQRHPRSNAQCDAAWGHHQPRWNFECREDCSEIQTPIFWLIRWFNDQHSKLILCKKTDELRNGQRLISDLVADDRDTDNHLFRSLCLSEIAQITIYFWFWVLDVTAPLILIQTSINLINNDEP